MLNFMVHKGLYSRVNSEI